MESRQKSNNRALTTSIHTIAEMNGLKNTTILDKLEKIQIEPQKGIAYVQKNGNHSTNILSRHCITSDTGFYRNPFLMIYQKESEGSVELDKALSDYLSSLEKRLIFN